VRSAEPGPVWSRHPHLNPLQNKGEDGSETGYQLLVMLIRKSKARLSVMRYLPRRIRPSAELSSEALFHFDGGRGFDVAAKTFAHGGEDLLRKSVLLARTETGVERNRKHFG
jgi:hypothetical protein